MAGFANTLDDLRYLGDLFCNARGWSLAALSRAACGSPMVCVRIKAGLGCHARNAEALSAYLAEYWPRGIAWPVGVPRLQRQHRRPLQRSRITVGAEAPGGR